MGPANPYSIKAISDAVAAHPARLPFPPPPFLILSIGIELGITVVLFPASAATGTAAGW